MIVKIMSFLIATIDNNALTDLGYLLDIQGSNDNGTLVANNSLLCFNAPVSWSRRSLSLLEYSISQVCLSVSALLII
jgi:hypothetical protein